MGSVFVGWDSDVYINFYDRSLSEQVASLSFMDIPKEVVKMSLDLPIDELELSDRLVIKREGIDFSIEFTFSFDTENWKKPWSISEYAIMMENATLRNNNKNIKWIRDPEFVSNGCCITICKIDSNKTINEVLNKYIPTVVEISGKAIEELSSRSNTITSIFRFPESVKSICEQYLMYFSQFLFELGIEANTDITHDAANVLFSVTPDSDHDALDKVRKALDIYLQLPNSPIFTEYLDIPMDIPTQQLLANVQHFKGQLLLANAMNQAKDVVIRAKDETITVLNTIIKQNIISTNILQEAMKYLDGKDEDRQEILNGTVTLKKIKGNGFELNLPKLYSRIKDALNKK